MFICLLGGFWTNKSKMSHFPSISTSQFNIILRSCEVFFCHKVWKSSLSVALARRWARCLCNRHISTINFQFYKIKRENLQRMLLVLLLLLFRWFLMRLFFSWHCFSHLATQRGKSGFAYLLCAKQPFHDWFPQLNFCKNWKKFYIQILQHKILDKLFILSSNFLPVYHVSKGRAF